MQKYTEAQSTDQKTFSYINEESLEFLSIRLMGRISSTTNKEIKSSCRVYLESADDII